MDRTLPLSDGLPHAPALSVSLPLARKGTAPLRWLRTVAAALSVMLAIVVGGVVVAAGAAPLHGLEALASLCALTAYSAEWAARRGRDPWAHSAASAAYVVAALLLPASWAVLVTLCATGGYCLMSRQGSPSARIVLLAHTILVVSIFTVVVHVVSGDRVLLDRMLAFVRNPAHGVRAALQTFGASPAPRHITGMGRLPDVPILAALVMLYYLLDTLPVIIVHTLAGADRRRHIWRRVYSRALCPEIGVLCLGALTAVAYTTAGAAALLALPALVGLHWGLVGARTHQAQEAEARVLRVDTAALYARVSDAQDREAERRVFLETVLASVRAIGGNEDLGEVTNALAQAALRLSAFQSCTIYLYESRHGVFVPHAGDVGRRSHRDVVPRSRVEVLMSEQNRLGCSYYVEHWQGGGLTSRAGRTVGAWSPGDTLLVPLLLKNGDVLGYITLDKPLNGRAPTASDLAPLETVAFLAAGVISRLRHTDEVMHLAATDGLTGLLNRRSFDERLRHELDIAARGNRALSLMMIDIDDFGHVNNAHGHQVGDDALRLVARVINDHLRESDAGGRYGGDEFAVILPGLTTARAADIAERLRVALVEATTQAARDGALPQIHTSIGVASYGDDARTMDDLFKAADDALYQSKHGGKNRVSVATK